MRSVRGRWAVLMAGVIWSGWLGLGGCGAGQGTTGPLVLPVDPVTELVGELHLHQFPLGSHAAADFVADPVAVSAVNNDQLVQLDPVPVASEGSCRLWRRPSCAPACKGLTWCAGTNSCQPLPLVRYVDGGPLRISGSRLHEVIKLDFTSPDTSYVSDPPPGDALLFSGGEMLRVRGGAGGGQIEGSLPAPLLLEVTQPDLAAPFHLPASGPLEIRWKPGGAALVLVSVNASQPDTGDYGYIRCVGPDSGSATIPASLLAGLPPPPRDNRLEIERDNEALLKTVTPGRGILAHAAFSAWVNGSD